MYDFKKRYDLVVGNPPFSKLKAKDAKKYLENNINKNTTNTFEFFLEKALAISDYVSMIMPKAILNTPEFSDTREILSHKKIDCMGKRRKNTLLWGTCVFIIRIFRLV